jgi:NAD(P)-dependent dehydrogenase (short-subunit alcohol dehydrogenase family)
MLRAMQRTVIITGGSSGIGAAAARALRREGVTVAITGRSPETHRLAKEIGCDAFITDFARFKDVRTLAEALLAKYPRIDVLANNVGGIFSRRELTEDGHEKTLQVNHLSGFLLTMLLRERLEASDAVVLNTSSGAHRWGHVDFDDLQNSRRYSSWRAYGTAKLMNILHAAEVNRRFRGVHGVSFHPGVVATAFAREGSPRTRQIYRGLFARLFMIPPEKGADTLVWLALAQPARDWTPGAFYVKRKIASTTAEAQDLAVASRLWDASEQMSRSLG